jgi:hypothetical protein
LSEVLLAIIRFLPAATGLSFMLSPEFLSIRLFALLGGGRDRTLEIKSFPNVLPPPPPPHLQQTSNLILKQHETLHWFDFL